MREARAVDLCGEGAFAKATAALVASPRNRGRVQRYLGNLTAHGSKEQEAASVAALIGKRSAASTLAKDRELTRIVDNDENV